MRRNQETKKSSRVLRRLIFASVGILVFVSCAAHATSEKILIFTKTMGFRHDNIDVGIKTLREVAPAEGLEVEATEDGANFSRENLRRFAAVVFFNTTGDVLSKEQEQAFREYIEAGGGFVGIHAASDTEYEWDWYGTALVGAYFKTHGPVALENISVVDAAHPSTEHLSPVWRRADEWYEFRSPPTRPVHILIKRGEGPHEGEPLAWCRTVGKGRAWYTALGHTRESFAEPEFLRHLVGGVNWATGRVAGTCE